MADITKCKGKDCKLKKSCYRYTAIDEILQSYFAESPFEQFDDEFYCKYYWDNNKGDNDATGN